MQLINLLSTFLSCGYCYDSGFCIYNFLIPNKVQAVNWETTLNDGFAFYIILCYVIWF